MDIENQKNGLFYKNTTMTFKDIRVSRAEALTEETETAYRHYIDELCTKIRNNERSMKDIFLGMAPTSTVSTMVAPNSFDPRNFLETRVKYGVEKRKLLIQLQLVLEDYEVLFGEFEDTKQIAKVFPEWKKGGVATMDPMDFSENEEEK